MRVAADVAAAGRRVSLHLQAAAHGACTAIGTVVRTTLDGFGVRFLDVNDAFRNLLWDLEATDERERRKIVAAIQDPRVTLL